MTNHGLTGTTVLVSGASIAGPALAFWLARHGAAVTVVEKAPELRTGGQAVDFKGAVHRAVLDHMGLYEEIERRATGGHDQTVIDADGRAITTIPGDFTGGDVEIRRGDLAAVLYEHTAETCEYVFGDTVTSLTETADGVHVTFREAAPRTFDLVVGADGIHSAVRRLAFGPEADFVRHLGYHYALADVGDLGLAGGAVMYNEPGRMCAVGGPKAPAFFVFATDADDRAARLDAARDDALAQQRMLAEAYRGAGWRVGEVVDRLPGSTGFYLDSISQVRIDRWSSGRIVLLGDSAWGNTLGGFGTGLAVVGAYVLAGELAAAGGDHRVAFAEYEAVMRRYAKVAKKGNAGPFLAPRTRAGGWLRNAIFRFRPMLALMLRMTDDYATDVDLRDYPRPSGVS
ncbi:FAD-dependent monooxygenase [Pseudonocardia benzenivorans]|uniref:FAD-dependent monooxygenase n=1 Tax=Pseudonocardia benzenivorans TaxID=228005 RepID=A0ABW3VLQ1_9PSEU|nr:FAD-dependent oxidoreductase [Pseudonocardia sp. D17]